MIVALAVSGLHSVPKIRSSPFEAFAKSVGTATGNRGRLFQVHFAREIGDLVFSEMAVNELKGLFGDAEVFGTGRVQGQAEGRRLYPPTHCFRGKSGIAA